MFWVSWLFLQFWEWITLRLVNIYVSLHYLPVFLDWNATDVWGGSVLHCGDSLQHCRILIFLALPPQMPVVPQITDTHRYFPHSSKHLHGEWHPYLVPRLISNYRWLRLENSQDWTSPDSPGKAYTWQLVSHPPPMPPSTSSLSFRVFIMKPVKLRSALFQRENASSTLEAAQFGGCRKLSLTLVWRSVCFHTRHMMYPSPKSIHLSASYCLYQVQRWWLNTLLFSFILTTFLPPLKMLFTFSFSRWRSQHFKRVYIKLIHFVVQ